MQTSLKTLLDFFKPDSMVVSSITVQPFIPEGEIEASKYMIGSYYGDAITNGKIIKKITVDKTSEMDKKIETLKSVNQIYNEFKKGLTAVNSYSLTRYIPQINPITIDLRIPFESSDVIESIRASVQDLLILFGTITCTKVGQLFLENQTNEVLDENIIPVDDNGSYERELVYNGNNYNVPKENVRLTIGQNTRSNRIYIGFVEIENEATTDVGISDNLLTPVEPVDPEQPTTTVPEYKRIHNINVNIITDIDIKKVGSTRLNTSVKLNTLTPDTGIIKLK